jgi:5-methylcytosine-specific restriction endonuclease McrA
MALPKKVRDLILERDPHCYHCGQTEDLVPHHRKNKGMGGSKLLDTPDNLMMVCSKYNGDMESNPRVAQQARAWNHKLPVWESTDWPVFDVAGGWWFLLRDGNRVRMSDTERF